MEYRMNRSLSASYRLAGVVFLAAAVLLWVCSGLELTGDDALVPFSAEKGEGREQLIRLVTEACGQ